METPLLITSTLNVPRVADALISYMLSRDKELGLARTANPVVLECFDGYLSDARARAVGEAEVFEAIAAAKERPPEEGCVGVVGVGMRCQGFKSA
jgi:D-aminopeptidase